jgi:glycosyltransferase involved in cell wall biosynthesis
MKISILLEAFQPEYWGGRETRWAKLIAELSSRHQITVFADFSRTSPDVAFPNLKIECVHIGQLPNMYTSRGSRSIKHAFLYSLKARKLLNRHADVILTDQTPLVFMPLIWLYSKLSKSKFSVVWHEFWDYQTWSQYSKLLAPIGVFIQNYAFLFSENIVVPSERVKSQIQKNKVGKKVTVIRNGFEQTHVENQFNGDKIKKECAKVELLYVGRLIKHKNVEFLISMLSSVKLQNLPWHLTIVGNGPIREELQFSVIESALENYVSFKSDVENSELERIYINSDVFVFPSEREGYGISVAEALIHNVPVIVFDTPSNASADLISNSNMGIKLEMLEVNSWINAILQISKSKSITISQDFQRSQNSWAEASFELEEFLGNLITTP